MDAKWIFRVLEGHEPYKILIRNNIERGVPKHAKSWKYLPLSDLIVGIFPILVQGSCMFKAIWKAWKHVRKHLKNTSAYNNDYIHGESSLG